MNWIYRQSVYKDHGANSRIEINIDGEDSDGVPIHFECFSYDQSKWDLAMTLEQFRKLVAGAEKLIEETGLGDSQSPKG